MTTTDIKHQIAQKLDLLSPSLLAAVNDFLGSLLAESSQASFTADTAVEKDFSNDPLVGLIDGSPKLASHAESFLQRERNNDDRLVDNSLLNSDEVWVGDDFEECLQSVYGTRS